MSAAEAADSIGFEGVRLWVAAPSRAAAADHSADMVAPISARSAASRSPGASTLMPLSLSCAHCCPVN